MGENRLWQFFRNEFKEKVTSSGAFQRISDQVRAKLAPILGQNDIPQDNHDHAQVMDRDQKNEMLIKGASNWNELYGVIDIVGPIETSTGTHLSPLESKRLVDKVRYAVDSTAVLNYITRTHGLRDKVGALLIQEEKEYQARISEQEQNLKAQVENAQNWEQLFQAIDKVAENNNQNIPLLSGGTATPLELKQAIYSAIYSHEPNQVLEPYKDRYGIYDKMQDIFRQRSQEQEEQNLGNEYEEQDIQADKENIVASANDWNELYQAIDKICEADGYIESSSGTKYSAFYLKEKIRDMYHSKDPFEALDLITRSYGLRKKATELLQQTYQAEQQFAQQEYENYADDFIKYVGESIKIRDPETYESQTIEEFTKEISELIQKAERRSRPVNKEEKIRIIAAYVNKRFPYDYSIFSRPDQMVEADKAMRVTQMIEIGKGVCRHQAVLMVALLRRFGFDAHQVWHDFEDGNSHTLAFVNDSDIKAFVHPANNGDPAAFIPYKDYEKYWKMKTKRWRYREGSNKWQDLNWEFHKR